jgi:NarL family two-component system response regulator LiaR
MYGVLMAIMIFVLKWLQWKYLITDNSLDIYIGLIAVFFTFLGVWVATQLAKPKIQTVIIEKEVYLTQPDDFTINKTELKKLNLSKREYEVLQHLTQGYSNAEIAVSYAEVLPIGLVVAFISSLILRRKPRL